jgi:hypothetical protein
MKGKHEHTHPGHNAVLHKHDHTQKRTEETASKITFHRKDNHTDYA